MSIELYSTQEPLEILGSIYLEPRQTFDKAIIGHDTKTRGIVYLYDRIIEVLTQEYMQDTEDEGEAQEEAREWVDYNTIRGVRYMPNPRPIIMGRNDNGELSILT